MEGSFYAEEEHRIAYTLEIEIPDSTRGWKRFEANPEAFVVNQMKKKQVEVQERKLSEEEAKRFSEAKSTEVKNFIAAECFKQLEGKVPDESKIIGMRWLLTWKYDPKYADGKKAKARAIVLGYQDPRYPWRETSAPTPSKAGRQLFLQYCAWRRFGIEKGDISGAFLQGEDLQDELWCRPLPEICDELGVDRETPMLLTKAAYGLVQAPLQWYLSICNTMKKLGYMRLTTEPCCWIYLDEKGVVRSIIHGHVDDFVFGGEATCPIHQRLLKEIQQAYKWGTWEKQKFEQCGIVLTQHDDFSITLRQERYIRELEEISISRDRARQEEQPTTSTEQSWMRGALGSLSWLCGQTSFQYSVDVGMLISQVKDSTVKDVNKLNTLIRQVKRSKDQEYRVHSFQPGEELVMVCWADAAWANRPNNKDSTEGVFIGMSTRRLLQGAEEDVTPLYWRSSKVGRVCRSPACAEGLAASSGEDDLLYLRVLWGEMCGHPVDVSDPSGFARHTPAALVTDSKNLFDKLKRPTVVIKGEKRSDIEAIALRQHVEDSDLRMCWVHGGAMIANSLTKPGEKHQLLTYIQLGFRYKIVFDEEMKSEKVRRREGRGVFEEETGPRGSLHTSSRTTR